MMQSSIVSDSYDAKMAEYNAARIAQETLQLDASKDKE